MDRDEYTRMYRLEDRHWWFVARRNLLTSALHRFPPPLKSNYSAPRVLDVGCGTGGTLDRFRASGISAMGLDMEPLALHFCRERGHPNLVLGSATDLPFADNTFAAAVAMDVLEHIPDHHAAAQEIRRVLMPGGYLYATVPAYRSLWSAHDIALMHQRRYVRREFAQLLSGAGLDLAHLTYTVSALLPAVWAVRGARRKLRPHAPPRADVGHVPSSLNRILRTGQDMENALALRRRLPFGLSLLAVARKPSANI